MSQAVAALAVAKDELDQAAARCDSAIEICTRYMMRAPLLIPARLLFMGVKTSIPTIKTGVDGAMGTVNSAGATAQGLLQTAVEGVLGLNQVLAQAIGRVKVAVDSFCPLIQQLQTTISSAGGRLDQLLGTLGTAVESAESQVGALVDRLDSTVQAFLQRINPDVFVAGLQARLKGMASSQAQSPMAPVAAFTSTHALSATASRLAQVARTHSSSVDDVGEASSDLAKCVDDISSAFRDLMLKALEQLEQLKTTQKICSSQASQAIEDWLEQAAGAVKALQALPPPSPVAGQSGGVAA